MPKAEHLRAIGGHYIGSSIERIFAGRQIRRSILLRDPVSQFISHYNFRMMRYLSQGLQAYSLEIAYHARPRNFLTHYILSNFLEISWPRLMSLSAQEKYVGVNRFLSTFWFVGDYSRCNDLIAALTLDLGVPSAAIARNTCAEWQHRVRWKPVNVEDLTPRMIDQIRQENALDQLLWETWRDVDQARISVLPHRMHDAPFKDLVAQESMRFVYQVRRRFHRSWRILAGGDMVSGTNDPLRKRRKGPAAVAKAWGPSASFANIMRFGSTQ